MAHSKCDGLLSIAIHSKWIKYNVLKDKHEHW